MNYLIVGATSVSGGATIEAIREFDKDSTITGTTSGDSQIETVDKTIFNIALDQPGATDAILAGVGDDNIDYVIYIPARGKVAMPATRAKQDEVDESLSYSVIPMLELHNKLQPKQTICFSGFIWFDNLLQSYGAMTFTKFLMEDLSVKFPDKLKIVRAGMFRSNSVRGISILVQRNLRADEIPEDMKPLHDAWRASGKKFKEFFEEENNKAESNAFKDQFSVPHRLTEPRDIKAAIKRILEGEKDPIVNIIGDWIWTDHEFPPFPDYVKDMAKDLLPPNLDRYLAS